MRLRRAVPAIAIAAAVLGVIALRRSATPDAGPVLLVRHVARAGDGASPQNEAPQNEAPQTEAEERAMALAASSMAPAERKRVLEGLDFATTRLEARLSPLATDFGDDDPVEQLRAFLVPYLPSFTAARELERGQWAARDLAVRVAVSCSEAHPREGERCIALWASDAGSTEDRQARFVGWAASHARRIELGTRDRALACARHLRERALLESSPIALVLLDDDLAIRASSDQAELQAAAKRLGRALAANDLEAPKELEAFARAPAEARVAPWLSVSPSQLVVIPRLSALGRDLDLDCARP